MSAALIACAACNRVEPARVSAPADSARGEVPFRLAGAENSAIVVESYINGRGPYELVLDTGASYTCIDEKLAQGLDLRATREPVIGSGVGGAREVTLVRVDSLRVGNASVHGVTGCVLQLGALKRLLDADGLLGLNFLRSFEVSLDFQRQVLRLTAAD